MKLILTNVLMLLFATSVTANENNNKINLSLPDGSWTGTNTYTQTNVPSSVDKLNVFIVSNVITMETFTEDFISIAIEQLVFKSANDIRWLDPQNREIGQCYCTTNVCKCSGNAIGSGGVVFSELLIQFFSDGKLSIFKYIEFSGGVATHFSELQPL